MQTHATTVDVLPQGQSVLDKVQEYFCWHEDMKMSRAGRMFCECAKCGRQTPGWTIESVPSERLARRNSNELGTEWPDSITVRSRPASDRQIREILPQAGLAITVDLVE